jgi:predicted MFS family arabinose efflux permease
MGPVIVVIYVVACLLVGLIGSRRSMGFFAAFFFSLIFSPILVILILQLTRTPRPSRRGRDRTSTPDA